MGAAGDVINPITPEFLEIVSVITAEKCWTGVVWQVCEVDHCQVKIHL